jgi:hypothetical protein
MNNLENRIWKGIEHFRSLKPSQLNFTQFGHLKVFLNLVEAYMNGDNTKEEKPVEEVANDVFGV